ncbi:MAG TPA: hypothetical protein VFX98_04190 [Longimicrobiaceae bacterium]|nr:hypothetical protein [Longimicrobiaceae bacterium]
MKRTALLPTLLLAAACATGAAGSAWQGEIHPSFLGTWKGSGVQSDDPQGGWTIAATLANGRVGTIVGTMTYPSVACGGDLVLRRARPDRLELLEDITFGDCVDQGIVTLTPSGDGGLDYAWHQDGNAMTATGTLTRAVR